MVMRKTKHEIVPGEKIESVLSHATPIGQYKCRLQTGYKMQTRYKMQTGYKTQTENRDCFLSDT